MKRWIKYFGTPEDTAETIIERSYPDEIFNICGEKCPFESNECYKPGHICKMDTIDGFIEYLEGDESEDV